MRHLATLSLAAVLCLGLAPAPTADTVYICTGPNATAYHLTQSCRGLGKCTHSIQAVTKAKAQGMGRTLCGWED